MGSGNKRGAVALSLKSTESIESFVAANAAEWRCNFQVNVLQIVPWHIKVYYHALQLLVDERPHMVIDFVERMRVSTSKEKASLGVMELVFKFPCKIKPAVLNIDFDKCSVPAFIGKSFAYHDAINFHGVLLYNINHFDLCSLISISYHSLLRNRTAGISKEGTLPRGCRCDFDPTGNPMWMNPRA